MEYAAPNVSVVPHGLADTGGRFWIEASATEGGAIIDLRDAPWANPLVENDSVWDLPVWLRAWEQGNHVVYEGLSPKSAWLHVI